MQAFDGHEGSWTGANSFRMMPTDQPDVAAATARVTVTAGVDLTSVHYQWSHTQDGAQAGVLVIGPDEEPGTVVALWGDSWHQHPAAKVLTGVIEAGVVTLRYTYGGDWEWIITVDASASEHLRIRMDNVVPASAVADPSAAGAYWAMRADLQRGG